MGRKWNAVWEKVLSAMLTANIAVMGWLWTNVARLADRLDKHVSDRSIHQELDRNEYLGRREFEAWRQHELAVKEDVSERLGKVEEKVDKVLEGRAKNAG